MRVFSWLFIREASPLHSRQFTTLHTATIMIQQSKFSIGDNVQIIDPEEKPSEWATFVITDIQSSRYCLAPKDKYRTYDKALWVDKHQITLISSESKSPKVCPNCQGKGKYQVFMGRDGWTLTTCPLCNPKDPWYKQYNPDK